MYTHMTYILAFLRGTRMTLKVAKRYFFLLKGTSLSYYKHEDSYSQGEPAMQRFNLTGSVLYLILYILILRFINVSSF